MTDEPSDTTPKNLVSLGDGESAGHRFDVEPRDHFRVGLGDSDISWQFHVGVITPEMYALGTALGIYSKAFVEALAKRHADGLANMLRGRFRKNGETSEAEIGLFGGGSATIAITADTPDEARLALLDLDVTADELRGKLLRWDSSASAWRPADDQ